jgi:hypothetical protein
LSFTFFFDTFFRRYQSFFALCFSFRAKSFFLEKKHERRKSREQRIEKNEEFEIHSFSVFCSGTENNSESTEGWISAVERLRSEWAESLLYFKLQMSL